MANVRHADLAHLINIFRYLAQVNLGQSEIVLAIAPLLELPREYSSPRSYASARATCRQRSGMRGAGVP